MIPVSIGSGILRSHRRIAKQEIQAAKMKRDIHMHQIGRKGLVLENSKRTGLFVSPIVLAI
jgi:hypothetical protein